MRSFGSIRLKHSSMSARAKLSGWVMGASFPPMNHSSMAQKCPSRTLIPRSLTIWATRGSCSVGPMGPHSPAGELAVDCCHARDVFQRLGDVEGLQRVIEGDRETRPRKLEEIPWGQPRGVVQDRRVQGGIVPPAFRHLARVSHRCSSDWEQSTLSAAAFPAAASPERGRLPPGSSTSGGTPPAPSARSCPRSARHRHARSGPLCS